MALQNVKNPDLWLQVKDDELSGNVRQWHEMLHNNAFYYVVGTI